MQLKELVVFLLEASSTQAKIISGYLKDLGVQQITTLESGSDALICMESVCPDLVISALYLPDMTGTDLVHSMRNHPLLKAVAFILISSETDIRVLDPIRQAGSIAILPKPFQAEQLRRALIATLDYYTPERLKLQLYDPENMQVLVVDDSRLARNHIKRMLTTMGMEHFTEAANGQEGVERIQQQFFDLVVTDYNMPEMDGKAFVDYIRNQSSQPSVPILMVTSEADQQRLASVEQAGVSAICDKPFEANTVRQLLQALFVESNE